MSQNLKQQIIVRPGNTLSGEITLAGAKNSALKIMAATVLTEGRYVISNVPRITDVKDMSELLRSLGAEVSHPPGGKMQIDIPPEINPVAPYDLVEKMRASISLLGPLLARCGKASVAAPGGDDFGPRPIGMHLAALEKLGADTRVSHGNMEVQAKKLKGSRIVFEFPSVGATENTMMAATMAKGETIIENAAREPEIADLADFLNAMGASVSGAGTSTLVVEGTDSLKAASHEVIPDRIEAFTYLTATGIAGGEISITNARVQHMEIACQKLQEMGMEISPTNISGETSAKSTAAGISAKATQRLKSVDVSSLPYPGVPTDCLPLLVALLSVSDGIGIVTENLFMGRFRYIDELVRMGADITIESHHGVIRGKKQLSGSPLRAPDIRAGAALVCAGLNAEGQTTISDIHHMERGYENLTGKLRKLGADITKDEI